MRRERESERERENLGWRSGSLLPPPFLLHPRGIALFVVPSRRPAGFSLTQGFGLLRRRGFLSVLFVSVGVIDSSELEREARRESARRTRLTRKTICFRRTLALALQKVATKIASTDMYLCRRARAHVCACACVMSHRRVAYAIFKSSFLILKLFSLLDPLIPYKRKRECAD